MLPAGKSATKAPHIAIRPMTRHSNSLCVLFFLLNNT